jgi:hypothetical protein
VYQQDLDNRELEVWAIDLRNHGTFIHDDGQFAYPSMAGDKKTRGLQDISLMGYSIVCGSTRMNDKGRK